MLLAAYTVNKTLFFMPKDSGGVSATEASDSRESYIYTENADGTVTIHTAALCGDVAGFHGAVPLDVTIKDGVITGITALKNNETPEYFSAATELFMRFKGMSASRVAVDRNVDAISGATYSSNAIIANVRAAATFYVTEIQGGSLPETSSANAVAGEAAAGMTESGATAGATQATAMTKRAGDGYMKQSAGDEGERKSAGKDAADKKAGITPVSTNDYTIESDGTVTIHTAGMCGDVTGYNGPVPLNVVIKGDTLRAITAMPNDETPGFFKRAQALFDTYTGMSAQAAANAAVDAITGATYSSEAIKANVRAAANLYLSTVSDKVSAKASNQVAEGNKTAETTSETVAYGPARETPEPYDGRTGASPRTDSAWHGTATDAHSSDNMPNGITDEPAVPGTSETCDEPVLKAGGMDGEQKTPLRLWVAFAVTLAGCVVPLFVKSRFYHTVQLIANVSVLGFWAGQYLDYALMLRWLSYGFDDLTTALVPVLMLLAAFVFPLTGHVEHYCTHVCPLGSAQQLAGMLWHRKVKMKSHTVKVLTGCRRMLWALLMLSLWLDVFTRWMDWELFGAFSVSTTSVVIAVTAAAFVILSLFVPRPYCRFVCPTGSLIKQSENL